MPKYLLCFLWITSVVNPFGNFSKGDETDSDALLDKHIKKLGGLWFCYQIICNVVTINQKSHKLMGGRVES